MLTRGFQVNSHLKMGGFGLICLIMVGTGCIPQPNLTYPDPAEIDFSTPQAPLNPRSDPQPPPPPLNDLGMDMEVIETDLEVDQDLPRPLRLRGRSLDWVNTPVNTRRVNETRVMGRFIWTRKASSEEKK